MNPLDIAILLVAAVVGLVSVLAARNVGPGLWLLSLWRWADPYVGCYIRRSPATFGYAAVLFVTTWVVAGTSPRIAAALLRSQSTNLDNLRAHPIDVLFRSAFWSGGRTVLPVVAALAVVLAPVEVWLGTARLILTFAAGHIGATLVTAVAISHGYFTSSAATGIDRAIDVGVSYGTVCVAAVLIHRLPRRSRLPAATALLVVFGLLAFVISKTFTDLGHFSAVLIGFAIYPLVHLHSSTVAERARIPLYRPWRQANPVSPGPGVTASPLPDLDD
jgi:hypothetical protein